jgi:hypothetical protein
MDGVKEEDITEVDLHINNSETLQVQF